MVEYCENDCGAIPQSQAETTMKTLNRKLCPKCADAENEKTADQLVPVKVRVRRTLEQEGYEQHNSNQNLYVKGDFPHKRFVDITRLPVAFEIGLLKSDGYRTTEEHGLADIDDLKNVIEGMITSGKTSGKTGNGTRRRSEPTVVKDSTRTDENEKEHTEEKKGKEAAATELEAATSAVKPAPAKSEPKKEEQKQNLPAAQEKPKPPGKPLTDAERDAMIERAKAEKFLTQRGSSYRVQGKERPDSHMIQNVANDRSICIEIREAVQTDNYAHVVVRGHLRDQYVDAVVHHDFSTEYLLKVMEIAKKNPQIIDHWEGTAPVLKADAVIETEDRGMKVKISAQYYVAHALLSFRKFALRDARTKAASITEAMLLNRDWRDEDEVDNEKAEAVLVQDIIQNRKEVS